MLELLIVTVGGIGLLILFVSFLVDAAWFTLYVTQPLVRLFQRVFLGIDEIKAGPETLIGQRAVIDRGFSRQNGETFSEGSVKVDGELWRARSGAEERYLVRGEPVTIIDRDGLILTIEPVTDQ